MTLDPVFIFTHLPCQYKKNWEEIILVTKKNIFEIDQFNFQSWKYQYSWKIVICLENAQRIKFFLKH